jgi:hypothetical protein
MDKKEQFFLAPTREGDGIILLLKHAMKGIIVEFGRFSSGFVSQASLILFSGKCHGHYPPQPTTTMS